MRRPSIQTRAGLSDVCGSPLWGTSPNISVSALHQLPGGPQQWLQTKQPQGSRSTSSCGTDPEDYCLPIGHHPNGHSPQNYPGCSAACFRFSDLYHCWVRPILSLVQLYTKIGLCLKICT
ncbi:hypothetical protein FKM82_008535 [Ascaphus truei]